MDKGDLRPNIEDWIGRPLVRFEDDRLVRGAGCFVDDLAPPGCLYLEFVRSPHADGRLREIDVAETMAAPGVVAVLTGADVTNIAAMAVNNLAGDMRLPDFSVLARDNIRSVGHPLAAIVAETAMAARDAALTVFADIDAESSGELGEGREVFSKGWRSGDVDAAFARASHVVSVEIAHPRVVPMALEPRATLAHWKPEANALTVWLSTQTPHRARADLARMLGLSESQIRVVTQDVGGAFGGKASIYPEDAVVAFASMRTGRPVKWCATRTEDMLAATHGRGAKTQGQLAISADGRLLGLRATLEFPLGYWLPYSAAAPGNNGGRILPGPYKVSAVDIRVRGNLSNTAPVNIYRGAGRPEAAMLMERLIDEASRVLSKDPIEIRTLNLIQPEEMPCRTPTGSLLDSGDYPTLLRKACALANYDGLRKERSARRRRGMVCGIGIGLYIEPCGQGWESASVQLEADGRIVVATGSSAQGQGRTTAFAQIAADALLLTPAAIEVRYGDTDQTPAGIGALASRSTAIGGSALLIACGKFCQEARKVAAQLMKLAEDSVTLIPGGFEEAQGGRRHVSWRQIAEGLSAESADAGSSVLKVTEVFHADGEAWSSGCCIAAVSIDRETGQLDIERIDWVDDAGVIVNPLLVKGQLVGGMAQGLGEALMEEIVYDATGQMLTGSLSDYAVPRASHIPPVQIGNLETPSLTNALGAKGVGEAGCIGIPAAIVNAAVDALSPFGVRHLDMPLTSAKLWHAMNRQIADTTKEATP